MKVAAIDIGSNAARLLIVDIIENKKETPEFIKLNLMRVPLRLGFDVFEKGIIGEKRKAMLLHTMHAFSHVLKAYDVPFTHLKSCATSAMRDAQNGAELIDLVQKETNIQIEIISGDKEAGLVFENHIAEKLEKNTSYLYIDVGGGSTEVSFYEKGEQRFKYSFNIGTIRVLRNDVSDDMWKQMQTMLKEHIKPKKALVAIGSGGNINKVFSLSKKKEGMPLPIALLKQNLKDMSVLNLEERMKKFKLKRDRADVIVPALQIYLNVMKWTGAEQIFVPKIGVADGLIQQLYKELKNN